MNNTSIKTWFRGQSWYRPEYKRATNIIGYIVMVLATGYLINLWGFSNQSVNIILFGFLLTGAGVMITLYHVDNHERKLANR